ncbi:M16 family metallopeptidase [Oxalobacteraceae bacterium A2-2]
MKLSPLRTLTAAVLLAASMMAGAIELKDPLPVNPELKVGKLANGLTYYIQKNAKPEKKLELRLVVKAGSILEDDDQQGLAHFTEHMAFNGSTHFKRNELVSYLQSAGVKFGADLNAYTSFDETVYMLPLPTDKREVVEKGFQVLEDWAHGLTLNDADIDSERNIVLEELRLGKGAEDRMNKVLLPKLLNGSRYAERLPIGKEEILKTFKYDALKRFYRDWYRPDLMAVIVVGDIDPADAQQLIEQHFGKLQNPANERPRVYAQIPERQESEGVVVTDKEASANGLYIRYPIKPVAPEVTLADYRERMIESIYSGILNQRMHELSQKAEPPFIQGGSGNSRMTQGYRSFGAGAVLGKGGVAPAIAALVAEDERARQFGFTASEVERAKKNMLRSLERSYNEREKTDSGAFVAEYTRNFLEQEAIPGIANEYAYYQQLMPGITVEEVNAAVRAAIPAGDKKLVIYTGVQREDAPPPKAGELVAMVNAAEQVKVKAQDEKVFASKLMETRPAGGRIAGTTHYQTLGITELTLGNGVKVVLKPTDFNNDQVLLASFRFGGQSLFDQSDILNARYASTLVAQMGVLDYTPADLGKVLAGQSVSAATSLGSMSEGTGGRSGSNDIEAMLQLVYLEMTKPRRDEVIFKSAMDSQRELAKSSMARPEAQFSDTITTTLFNNSPYVPRTARPEDFDKIQLDRVMQIYRDRMSSAKGFTFFLVGSFDVEKVKPLLAAYLGTLPVGEVPTMYRDLGVRPVRGVVKKEVHAGTEAKSTISITFTGNAEYSSAEQMRLQAVIEALNIKLVEVLREKMSLIYGGGMGGNLSKLPYGNYSITISLPCGPENVDKVIAATFAEIRKVKEHGVEPGDLEKVRAAWLKNHRKNLRENGYWLNQLQSALINGTDPASLLTYEERVMAIQPQELAATAKRYFDMDNYVQVVLYPEKKPD